MKIKINEKEVKGNCFAFDGCHKMYIIEDKKDEEDARECGYVILDIGMLEDVYRRSCDLKFIHNWKLTTTYVAQFEQVTFIYEH